MSSCPNCGFEVGNALFCTQCGQSMRDAVSSRYADAPVPAFTNTSRSIDKRSMTWLWLVLGTLGVCFIAVLSAFVWTQTERSRTVVEPGAPADSQSANSYVEPESGSAVGAAGTTATATVTVTARPPSPTAPVVPQVSADPAAFISGLYVDWTQRNQAAVASKVSPAYVNQFPNKLLDNQDIIAVQSSNNVVSGSATSPRVCGNQTFIKADGRKQLEYRCFSLGAVGGTWQVVWTGDSDTLETWR